MTELQTTASTQNHQPAANIAPATPGPKIAQSSDRSISCDFQSSPDEFDRGDVFDFGGFF